MIRVILTDIEGTTTSIRFVVDVLFPYARAHMAEFIQLHVNEEKVRAQLDDVIKLADIDNSLDAITKQLIQWIDEDKKITPLKALQGMIWKHGYESGDFKGHVYADVRPNLEKWHAAGLQLYVYSSGSVEAQQLIFGYSEVGDLTGLFTAYFDTRIGNKRDPEAYKNIIAEIGGEADEILFLSDIEEELDAAKQAGMDTLQLVREETRPSTKHSFVRSFDEIDIRSI